MTASAIDMAMDQHQMSDVATTDHQMADQRMADASFADVRGADELEVEAYDNLFEPAEIKAAPGQTVALKISNAGRSLHNFSIPGAGIDRDVAPGGNVELSVTFPADGALEYFCKFHRALGMTGRLVAEDPGSASAW